MNDDSIVNIIKATKIIFVIFCLLNSVILSLFISIVIIFIINIDINTPSGNGVKYLITIVITPNKIPLIIWPFLVIGVVTGSVDIKTAPKRRPPLSILNSINHSPIFFVIHIIRLITITVDT